MYFPSSPLVGVYCGSVTPFAEFNLTLNELYVRFVSDGQQTRHAGFVATYTVNGKLLHFQTFSRCQARRQDFVDGGGGGGGWGRESFTAA